jgi:hypothetical protein
MSDNISMFELEVSKFDHVAAGNKVIEEFRSFVASNPGKVDLGYMAECLELDEDRLWEFVNLEKPPVPSRKEFCGILLAICLAIDTVINSDFLDSPEWSNKESLQREWINIRNGNDNPVFKIEEAKKWVWFYYLERCLGKFN